MLFKHLVEAAPEEKVVVSTRAVARVLNVLVMNALFEMPDGEHWSSLSIGHLGSFHQMYRFLDLKVFFLIARYITA